MFQASVSEISAYSFKIFIPLSYLSNVVLFIIMLVKDEKIFRVFYTCQLKRTVNLHFFDKLLGHLNIAYKIREGGYVLVEAISLGENDSEMGFDGFKILDKERVVLDSIFEFEQVQKRFQSLLEVRVLCNRSNCLASSRHNPGIALKSFNLKTIIWIVSKHLANHQLTRVRYERELSSNHIKRTFRN